MFASFICFSIESKIKVTKTLFIVLDYKKLIAKWKKKQ